METNSYLRRTVLFRRHGNPETKAEINSYPRRTVPLPPAVCVCSKLGLFLSKVLVSTATHMGPLRSTCSKDAARGAFISEGRDTPGGRVCLCVDRRV